MCESTHEKDRGEPRVFSDAIHILIFETGSLISPELAEKASLIGQRALGSCFTHFPSTGITPACDTKLVTLFMYVLGIELRCLSSQGKHLSDSTIS